MYFSVIKIQNIIGVFIHIFSS